MRPIEERAAGAYRTRFGAWPELVAGAPGRVNLIGEHTDYNDGFVLPCAIDRRTAVAIGRTAGAAALYSADFGEERPAVPERDDSWADYPRAVVWALHAAGHNLPPFRAAIAGDVPQGAGLSSSAAIEAATALALDALFGLGVARRDLAVLCRRADNAFLEIPSGIMDQYAALLCRAGSALFIDCRSLEAEPVPLDLDAAGLVLLVCDTRVARALRAPESAYRLRQEACARAARRLGLASLRDATPADVDRLDGEERRRARHVVSEDARVLAAVAALRAGDFAAFGRLMDASHVSLRDDYEVSTPELDAFVAAACDGGALGARLTGAGFGGCAIALVPADVAATLEAAARRAFAARGFAAPEFYRFRPAAGGEVTQ